MSYDFELFTSTERAIDPPPSGPGFHVRVDGPDRVDPEDLDEGYLPVIRSRRFLRMIHLEGDPSGSDRVAIDIWLAATIAQSKGVLIDLQTGRFETAAKAGFIKPSSDLPTEGGWMTFHFTDAQRFYDQGFEGMLRQISALMPEALPTRFGSHEPLQGKVVDGDVSDLVTLFKSDPRMSMKASAPFGDIVMSVPCRCFTDMYSERHFLRREFVMGFVSFRIRPKLFANPAAVARLRALFDGLCVALDVSYAEIVETDRMGTLFWRGLPDHDTRTICVGPPYLEAWPEIGDMGQPVGTHHRVVTTDRLGNRPPRPPTRLIAPEQPDKAPGGKPAYAPVFPFDYEFDFDRYVW